MRDVYRLIFVVLHASALHAQVYVHGTVYNDAAFSRPLEAALVYTSSGTYVYTGKAGNYTIVARLDDTLRVYYESKIFSLPLSNYLVSKDHFDIYFSDTLNGRLLYNQLKPVFVKSNNYRADSIKNRQEYGDIFDYRRNKVSMGNNKWHDSINTLGGKVAIDTKNKKLSLLNVTSVAHAISNKKGSQKLRLQKRLVATEQSDYVNRVFTAALVEKYTNMHDDDSLHIFIKQYAPPFNNLVNMNDLDLAMYIVNNMRIYRSRR